MRISDWSSDVCSSDLVAGAGGHADGGARGSDGGDAARGDVARPGTAGGEQDQGDRGELAQFHGYADLLNRRRAAVRLGPNRWDARSEERRAGQDGVSTGWCWWSQDH